jgi:hypothetical protein
VNVAGDEQKIGVAVGRIVVVVNRHLCREIHILVVGIQHANVFRMPAQAGGQI